MSSLDAYWHFIRIVSYLAAYGQPIAVERSIGVKRICASSLFGHFNNVMSSLDAYWHFIRIVSYLAAYGHFICVWEVYWGIKKAAQAINLAAFF